jgi:hypothetical protein
MSWINEAHRGMRLQPTKTAVKEKILRQGVYTFCSWATRGQIAEIERLGTRKRKQVKIEHLQLEK